MSLSFFGKLNLPRKLYPTDRKNSYEKGGPHLGVLKPVCARVQSNLSKKINRLVQEGPGGHLSAPTGLGIEDMGTNFGVLKPRVRSLHELFRHVHSTFHFAQGTYRYERFCMLLLFLLFKLWEVSESYCKFVIDFECDWKHLNVFECF